MWFKSKACACANDDDPWSIHWARFPGTATACHAGRFPSHEDVMKRLQAMSKKHREHVTQILQVCVFGICGALPYFFSPPSCAAQIGITANSTF